MLVTLSALFFAGGYKLCTVENDPVAGVLSCLVAWVLLIIQLSSDKMEEDKGNGSKS